MSASLHSSRRRNAIRLKVARLRGRIRQAVRAHLAALLWRARA